VPMQPGDLRGAARLAVQATLGVTTLVEAVHARVASMPGLVAQREHTLGITGWVYRSVRGITRAVGATLEGALTLLEPALNDLGQHPCPEREALVSALNGVLGDHLANSQNPLAIQLEFRQNGLHFEPTAASSDGMLLMLHGLCMNDHQWRQAGHDHGAVLAQALGLTPVYLRYNTGLAIHDNGAQLAQQLEALSAAWPGRLKRIVLLGHSMGGLLARSALHQATAQALRWPLAVSDMVCLGSPHHGARLERIAVDRLLEASPYAAPFARLGKLRSAGITSLRHGAVLPGNALAPLPQGLRCFALAGRLQGRLQARALGDGLVSVRSALGQHRDPNRHLRFLPACSAVVDGAGHLALLSDPAVQAKLLGWLLPANAQEA
jgi:pimeloyl-ACP methyl ester carboxylesterase